MPPTFSGTRVEPLDTPPACPRNWTRAVAVVDAGPAACHAAEELLRPADVEVELFDRLPTHHGLVRAGVAPEHQGERVVSSAAAIRPLMWRSC
ncbi:hypothetical protein ACIBJI_08305 [Nocardia sp. NPDC050408]|uniref:hypothetical protein n=1 Tax=unclassified Nocardia TaxID=2637762 RepID=UPI003448B7E8